MFLAIFVTLLMSAMIILSCAQFKSGDYFIGIMTSIVALVYFYLLVIALKDLGYKEGQKDALKGNFKYEMKIQYELQGSTYTPADTTFVLIEENKE